MLDFFNSMSAKDKERVMRLVGDATLFFIFYVPTILESIMMKCAFFEE